MSDLQTTGCGCGGSGNDRVGSVYYHLMQADAPLAMAYVPYQQWEMPYAPCKALQAGTIFQGLNKPFCGRGGNCR